MIFNLFNFSAETVLLLGRREGWNQYACEWDFLKPTKLSRIIQNDK